MARRYGSKNKKNRLKNKTPNITFDKTRNKWTVRLFIGSVIYYLGRYHSKDEAIQVRNNFIIENEDMIRTHTRMGKFEKNFPLYPLEGR